MAPVRSVDDLRWIGDGLSGRGSVAATVPRGFEAYVRVLHPALGRFEARGPGGRPVDVPLTWQQVATIFGTVAHPAMQWDSITRGGDDHDQVVDRPATGELERGSFARLATLLADSSGADTTVRIGCWEGSGPFAGATRISWFPDGSTVRERIEPLDLEGPLLELPDRRYAVLAGRLGELVDGSWTGALMRPGDQFPPASPHLIWPEDRSWFVATEIDFDSTLVGGSRGLADRLLSDGLEVLEVDGDTSLALDGDEINGVP